MPPKGSKAATTTARTVVVRPSVKAEAPTRVAVPATATATLSPFDRATRVLAVAHVLTALIKANATAGCHTAQRKVLLGQYQLMPAVVADGVARAVLKACTSEIGESLKRLASFLAELCKTMRSTHDDDVLAETVIKALLPLHNAADKTVRTAVISLVEQLLRTLKADDAANAKPQRAALFDTLVGALCERIHDKHAAVREKAVAAVGLFQLARKDDDLTQCLLFAMCEDFNAAVRRQAVCSVTAQKEIYFGSVVRLTGDVVSSVRMAAWDMLGQYKFSRLVAFARVQSIDVVSLITTGLHDASQLVRVAAASALTRGWLHRDCQGNCMALISGIEFGTQAGSALALEIASVVYRSARKSAANRDVEAKLLSEAALDLKSLTTANALCWKAACLDALEGSAHVGDRTLMGGRSQGQQGNDAATEALMLPSITEFSAILRDVVTVYAKPSDNTRPNRVVTLAKPEEQADQILQILLSMFPAYDDAGYLVHCDEATRITIMKPLVRLLTMVADNDTAMFVADIMRGMRALFHRHPAEAASCVADAVRRLFDGLVLPRWFGLGFDDVEQFGRQDAERRRELGALQHRPGAAERVEVLAQSIDTDTLYMLRMQHIAHHFLSQLNRTDKVPDFCAHLIRLGRHQQDAAVKAMATRSLGLQLLMSPESVHTFVPLLIADVVSVRSSAHAATEDATSPCWQESALGVLFDLVSEYGLPFFQAVETVRLPPRSVAESGLSEDAAIASAASTAAVAESHRRLLESTAANDDAKVGGGHLLRTLLSFIVPGATAPWGMRRTATVGFMKLLACSRIPAGNDAVVVLAMTLRAAFSQARGAQTSRQPQELMKVADQFFSSFAASHQRRMKLVAEAGVLAARLGLAEVATVASSNAGLRAAMLADVQRVVRRLILYSDASLLAHIRDLDPAFARLNASHNDGNGDTATRQKTAEASSATLAAGNARLWRELTLHSCHEYVACELLLEISLARGSIANQRCLAACLSSLRLYKRDHDTLDMIEDFTQRASLAISGRGAAADDEPASVDISAFLEACRQLGNKGPDAARGSGELTERPDFATGQQSRAEMLRIARATIVAAGGLELSIGSSAAESPASGRGSRKSDRRTNDAATGDEGGVSPRRLDLDEVDVFQAPRRRSDSSDGVPLPRPHRGGRAARR